MATTTGMCRSSNSRHHSRVYGGQLVIMSFGFVRGSTDLDKWARPKKQRHVHELIVHDGWMPSTNFQ